MFIKNQNHPDFQKTKFLLAGFHVLYLDHAFELLPSSLEKLCLFDNKAALILISRLILSLENNIAFASDIKSFDIWY